MLNYFTNSSELSGIYETAVSIHNEKGMQMMFEYLYDLSGAGVISEEDADLIGEEIMIYGC